MVVNMLLSTMSSFFPSLVSLSLSVGPSFSSHARLECKSGRKKKEAKECFLTRRRKDLRFLHLDFRIVLSLSPSQHCLSLNPHSFFIPPAFSRAREKEKEKFEISRYAAPRKKNRPHEHARGRIFFFFVQTNLTSRALVCFN